MKKRLLTVIILMLTLAPNSRATELCSHFSVISHRGLSGLAPEESRFAYEMAANLQTDFLEMDIQRTHDGVLIANHDNDFARTTNVAQVYPGRVKEQISQFTFPEVSKLETGAWFNQKFPAFAKKQFVSTPILKLAEVIQIALQSPNHPGLYIETKSPELYSGIEKDIVDLLTKARAFKKLKIIFQSFDASSLGRFKALKPDVPRIYLSEAPYEKLDQDLKIAQEQGSGIGPDANEMSGDHLNQFLKKAHAMHLLVHFYTVDGVPEMSRLIQAGSDGIFTNRTDLLLQACHRIAQAEGVNALAQ